MWIKPGECSHVNNQNMKMQSIGNLGHVFLRRCALAEAWPPLHPTNPEDTVWPRLFYMYMRTTRRTFAHAQHAFVQHDHEAMQEREKDLALDFKASTWRRNYYTTRRHLVCFIRVSVHTPHMMRRPVRVSIMSENAWTTPRITTTREKIGNHPAPQ